MVVIEHHHSRSDPLPMDNVLKDMKAHFSTPRIYESDSSASASSLYARINPKLKSRFPRLPQSPEEPIYNETKGQADLVQAENNYTKLGPGNYF